MQYPPVPLCAFRGIRHIKKDGSLQRIELRDLRDKQIFADLVRQGISPALF